MTIDGINRPAVHRVLLFVAVIVAAALQAASAPAAEANAPTTFQECYRSTHTCQKARCKALDGHEQVTCMQQCNREYESCASHAKSGSTAGGSAEPTAGKGQRHHRGAKEGAEE
jgi:hypothetical protein